MGLRQLTIPEAAASRNIWFNVETEEQQRRFQEEFLASGGKLALAYFNINTRKTVALIIENGYLNSINNTMYVNSEIEQVQILWQEEPSISIASLAPEVALTVTLNHSLNWQDTLSLLTQLKNEELTKEFISDKCLRRMEDEKLASLASFLIEKRNVTGEGMEKVETVFAILGYVDNKQLKEQEDIVKSFVLIVKKHLTKRTKQTEYWYKFYRKEVERVVRQAQAGLYQKELKASSEWEGLSWERRGEE
jgi:hypothetical protein